MKLIRDVIIPCVHKAQRLKMLITCGSWKPRLHSHHGPYLTKAWCSLAHSLDTRPSAFSLAPYLVRKPGGLVPQSLVSCKTAVEWMLDENALTGDSGSPIPVAAGPLA